eukprot:gene24150-biopygen14929
MDTSRCPAPSAGAGELPAMDSLKAPGSLAMGPIDAYGTRHGDGFARARSGLHKKLCFQFPPGSLLDQAHARKMRFFERLVAESGQGFSSLSLHARIRPLPPPPPDLAQTRMTSGVGGHCLSIGGSGKIASKPASIFLVYTGGRLRASGWRKHVFWWVEEPFGIFWSILDAKSRRNRLGLRVTQTDIRAPPEHGSHGWHPQL